MHSHTIGTFALVMCSGGVTLACAVPCAVPCAALCAVPFAVVLWMLGCTRLGGRNWSCFVIPLSLLGALAPNGLGRTGTCATAARAGPKTSKNTEGIHSATCKHVERQHCILGITHAFFGIWI